MERTHAGSTNRVAYPENPFLCGKNVASSPNAIITEQQTPAMMMNPMTIPTGPPFASAVPELMAIPVPIDPPSAIIEILQKIDGQDNEDSDREER